MGDGDSAQATRVERCAKSRAGRKAAYPIGVPKPPAHLTSPQQVPAAFYNGAPDDEAAKMEEAMGAGLRGPKVLPATKLS